MIFGKNKNIYFMNYYTDVLKKYAVFGGRARRKEYWMFVLWNLIIYVVLGFVLGIIGKAINSQMPMVLAYLYALAVLIPNLAVSVRRLHDTGRSGWWLLIGLVPLVGAIVLLVFTVMDSMPGENKYGPNPKGVTAPAAVSQGPVQQ
jgi:uncharacterized membrane protein YhaH (DUF805 family)